MMFAGEHPFPGTAHQLSGVRCLCIKDAKGGRFVFRSNHDKTETMTMGIGFKSESFSC
jgi:hypothetical protein